MPECQAPLASWVTDPARPTVFLIGASHEERGVGPDELPCAAGACLWTFESLCHVTFISRLLLLNRVLLWPRACWLQTHLSLPYQLTTGWVQPRGALDCERRAPGKGKLRCFSSPQPVSISSLALDPSSQRVTRALGSHGPASCLCPSSKGWQVASYHLSF